MAQVDGYWFAAREKSDLDDSLSAAPKDVFAVVNKVEQTIYVEASVVDDVLAESEEGPIRLNIEDKDLADLREHLDVDGDRKLERTELASANFDIEEGVRLLGNDAFRSQVTQKLEASGVRFRWNGPKNLFGLSSSGVLDFQDDIVSVGTDDAGKILTFICPMVSKRAEYLLGLSTAFNAEVEIGQVGGSVDPVTGIGTIYLDKVRFKLWGSVESKSPLGITSFGVSERDAATVPVLPKSQSGSLIVLNNITPGAYAGQSADKAFASFLVQAQQGKSPAQPFAQELIKSVVDNFVFPGLLSEGTSLQWNIDLKAPFAVNGL